MSYDQSKLIFTSLSECALVSRGGKQPDDKKRVRSPSSPWGKQIYFGERKKTHCVVTIELISTNTGFNLRKNTAHCCISNEISELNGNSRSIWTVNRVSAAKARIMIHYSDVFCPESNDKATFVHALF